MNFKNLFFLLSIFAFLSGCTTMSETECLSTNWEQVGLEDGKKGVGSFSASSYQESCGKYDVPVDMAAYNQGHVNGVALFCQADNGFELGEQGYKYTVYCPQAFEEQYAIGYQFYLAYNNISQMENALYTNETNINKLESGINNAYFRLSSETLSVFEENELRQRIDSMSGQIKDYQLSTERLEPMLRQSQQQLERLRSQYR